LRTVVQCENQQIATSQDGWLDVFFWEHHHPQLAYIIGCEEFPADQWTLQGELAVNLATTEFDLLIVIG
jgi:hypothetical protein